MAKVKFKVSVKEICFEYEGDFEQGRTIQQGITQTLGNLANLQHRAMGLPDANGNGQSRMIESRPIDSPRGGRRGPRRRTSPTLPTVPADGAAAGGDGVAADSGSTPRRSSGASPTKLLVQLRKDAFFAQQQGVGQIVDELQRRGYGSMKSSDISSQLAKLVQKGVLSRNENDKGNWVYSNGVHEEPPKANPQ